MLILSFAATAMIFVWRFAGFSLKLNADSAQWASLLHFVPVSVFAALIVSALYSSPELSGVKLAALVCAAITFWRFRQAGLGIFVGLVALWLLASVWTQ